MAKYAIAGSTSTAATLKAALVSSGITHTIYYEATAFLIFSAPNYCNKVIKINADSSSLKISLGDSWTSTSSITNEATLVQGNTACAGGYLIVTPNVLALSLQDTTSSNAVNSIFSKSDSGDFCAFMGSGYSTASQGHWRNLTSNSIYLPLCSRYPLVSPSGNYYTEQLKVKNSGNQMQSVTFTGLKYLSRGIVVKEAMCILGNDISLAIEFINASNVNASTHILIENGNI